MNMVCKCGGKEFFTEEHGNQTGLYCSAYLHESCRHEGA